MLSPRNSLFPCKKFLAPPFFFYKVNGFLRRTGRRLDGQLAGNMRALRSRCRTRFSWQNAVPLRSWYMKLRTVLGSRAPRSPFVSIYFFRSCSQYSKMRTNFVSVCITSCRRTMFTCLSSFMREISRMAVEGVPSSASKWISFSATISFVVLERPL